MHDGEDVASTNKPIPEEHAQTFNKQPNTSLEDERRRAKAVRCLTYGCTVVHLPSDPIETGQSVVVRLFLHPVDMTKLLYINPFKLSEGQQTLDLLNLKRVSTAKYVDHLLEGKLLRVFRLVFLDASIFSVGVVSEDYYQSLLLFFNRFVEAKTNHPLRL